MISFIEVTLILTDVTLKALHFASKHDSIHMCELLHAACEPLYSKCSADKSLTSIFYSWGPSRSVYHFCNSPCANTSCSVSPVLLRPWEMSTKVILSPPPLHHCGATSPGSLFCCQRWFHCIHRLGLDCAAAFFLNFPINSSANKKVRYGGRRHGGKQTGLRYLHRGETLPSGEIKV